MHGGRGIVSRLMSANEGAAMRYLRSVRRFRCRDLRCEK